MGVRNSSTLYTMPVTWQTKFLERRASASVGSLISRRKIGKTLPSFLLFKRSALAKLILFKSKNSLNSESETSFGTPFTARLLVCCLLIWKALGKLTFTFWPNAAFILLSFCKIMTSCIESPMIKKSPFGSSLIWETLRPGWNCLNSPRSLRQFLCSALIPLRMTGMLFLIIVGLGRVGVPGGSSEEPVFCRVGSVGEPKALRFLRL